MGPSKLRVAGSPAKYAVVWLLALFLLFISMAPMIGLYDEGLVLFGADRVQRGDLPYRDFWTMYGPAEFYLVAAAFSVFGKSVLTLRFVDLIIKATIVTASYAIVRRLSSRIVAGFAAGAVLGVLISVRNYGFPVFGALAFSLLGLLTLQRGVYKDRRYLILAGALTGLVAAFRQDLGAYDAVCSLLMLALAGRAAGPDHSAALQKGFLPLFWGYATGLILTALPVVILLFASVPMSDLYYDLIYVPAKIYPQVRKIAFPLPGQWSYGGIDAIQFNIHLFSVYIPFLVGCFFALAGLRKWVLAQAGGTTPSRVLLDENQFLVVALVLLTLLFTLKGMVRVQELHMVQAIIPAILLTASLVKADSAEKLGRVAARTLIAIVAVYCLGMIGASFVMTARNLFGPDRLVDRCFFPALPAARCEETDVWTADAVKYISENSQANDLIYVGNDRHDRLLINDIAIYFLAQREAATKWHDLHPGVETTSAIQQQMIGEFEKHPPKFVVLDSRWDAVHEANASNVSSGVFLLDDYIRKHYQDIRDFGSIRILSTRDVPADFSDPR